MKKFIKNKQSGFTLVETIIYIGIIGAVLHGFVTFAIFTAVNNAKTIAVEDVQTSSQIALDYISRKIREADNVVLPLSGQQANRLEIEYSTAPNITFEVVGGILYANTDRLSGKNIIVSDLVFYHLGENSNKSNVLFEFTVTYDNKNPVAYDYSQKIKSSATLRK